MTDMAAADTRSMLGDEWHRRWYMTPELVTQLPDLERQADELERRAQAIRQIIAGVRALNGDATAILTRRTFESHRTSFEIAPHDTLGPRGPEAVLRIMQEHPRRDWKVVDLKREMLRRGWAPTPKAVEASVKRLKQQRRVMSLSYGHYRLAAAETAKEIGSDHFDSREERSGDHLQISGAG